MWGYSCYLWRNSGHSSQPGKGDILVVSVVWNVQVFVCSAMIMKWPRLILMFCEIVFDRRTPRPRARPALWRRGCFSPFQWAYVCCQQYHQILVNVHGERGQHCPWVPWPWLALPLIILSLFSPLQDTASALIIDKSFIKHFGSSQVFSSTLEDGLCCQDSS